MKVRFLILTVMFAFLFVGNINAQKLPKKPTVFIKTNTQCGDCKQRVEKILNFERGIIYAELHVDRKEIEVKYNSKRTDIDKIRKKISEIGYAADDVEPVQSAQENLPMCCRPGGHD